MPIELFRYLGAAKDGGTLEYIFEAGEQNSPNAVTKEKAAEIATDFMTTFIASRSEHWKRRNFGERPFRFGWCAFRRRSRDPCDKCSLSFCCRMGRLLCREWKSDCRHIAASRK